MTTKVRGSDQLMPTGAEEGVYGNSTHVAQITVLASGQISAVSEVPISGGGGGSITVEEEGGGITIPDVTVIKVTDGHLADDGGDAALNFGISVLQDGSPAGSSDAVDFVNGDGAAIEVTQSTPADPVVITVKTILERASLTEQTANISPTDLFTAAQNGQYLVSYYLVVTTADVTAGGITLSVVAHDGTASRTFDSTALPLTSTGLQSGTFLIRVGDSNPPTYAVTHTGIFGSSEYSLYLSIQPMGLG